LLRRRVLRSLHGRPLLPLQAASLRRRVRYRFFRPHPYSGPVLISARLLRLGSQRPRWTRRQHSGSGMLCDSVWLLGKHRKASHYALPSSPIGFRAAFRFVSLPQKHRSTGVRASLAG
jgi:hypothetical protein